MRKYFLLFFLLYSNISYSQEVLELETVEIESSQTDTNYSMVTRVDLPIIRSVIQDTKELSVRQYSPSDVLISFHNVTLNNSADNKVELHHYPKYLLRNISLSDRLAFGPAFSLQEEDIDGSILSNIQITTLKDFELYNQFKLDYISGFFFGSLSSGDFEFVNSKGDRQIRENNNQQRLGFSVYHTYQADTTVIQPFLFYSTFTRGVGGMSEFPQRYKEAEESGDLGLFNLTTYSLLSSLELNNSVSYRYQKYSYINPHSKFVRDSKVDTEDKALEILSYVRYPIYYFIFGGDIRYSYNSYLENNRQIFTINSYILYEYSNLSLSVESPLLIEDTVYPQYSLLSQYSYEDFIISVGTSRTVRLPTFNELYFRNEFVHGDSNLDPQVNYKTSLSVKYSYSDIIDLSLIGEYSYFQDLIRFTQDTPYLFVAHNIPTVHVLTISPSIQVNYSLFTLQANYSYSYSKVKDLGKLPLLSEHEFHLSTGFQSEDYKVLLLYSYSSPKYLHFTNTTESISDSNLSIKLAYKYAFVEALMEFNNILNSRKETSIQFPLPRFNASFSLKIFL